MSEQGPQVRIAVDASVVARARQRLREHRAQDYSFRCECGWSTRDTRYEAHACPESAGSVRPTGNEETSG